MTDLGDARQLLADALSEPFYEELDSNHPINRWLNFLSESFPLWTFQTGEFMSLQETDRPSTAPLETIIKSVLSDGGWDRGGGYFESSDDYLLVENVYARRDELGRGKRGIFHSGYFYTRSDGSPGVKATSPSSLLSLTDVPHMQDWDDDGPAGAYSPYDGIGRELVDRVEALNVASSTKERDAAKDELEAYIQEIGGKLAAHGPALGPPAALLKQLFEEGKRLVKVLWTPLAEGLPNETCDILGSLGADGDSFQSWAIRLAIPALSWPELQALREERTEASSWTKTGPRPTARRLTIWMLSHRLGSPPQRLANKLGAGSDWDHFKEATNPIEAHLPHHE